MLVHVNTKQLGLRNFHFKSRFANEYFASSCHSPGPRCARRMTTELPLAHKSGWNVLNPPVFHDHPYNLHINNTKGCKEFVLHLWHKQAGVRDQLTRLTNLIREHANYHYKKLSFDLPWMPHEMLNKPNNLWNFFFVSPLPVRNRISPTAHKSLLPTKCSDVWVYFWFSVERDPI
jgi:hypothetical protein